MRKSIAFLILNIFSLHAMHNFGTESPKVIKIRTLNRLAYEMDIIKKLPGAIGRCLKAQGTCSVADKKEIEQGIKRILVVIGVLLVSIPTIYTLHKKFKKEHAVVSKSKGTLSAPEQKQIIGDFSEVVRNSEIEELHKLFSRYTLSQESLKDFLEEAVAFADANIVKALIDHMKNPSFTTKEGDPIFKVIIAKRPGILKSEGPLRESSESKVNGVLMALCEKGADPNSRYKNGWTPLMHAAYLDLEHVVRILLNCNADRELKNNEGKTAYDLAVENDASESVKQKVAF